MLRYGRCVHKMLQDLEENNKALVSSSERMRAELERVVRECGTLRRQVVTAVAADGSLKFLQETAFPLGKLSFTF